MRRDNNAPSIRIYQPMALGAGYLADVTRHAARYRQTIRLYGGYWTATWDMINMSPRSMISFFKRRIGAHVSIVSGGIIIWEGLIWSMDIVQKGVVRRVTLDKVRNAVKCIYTDVDAEEEEDPRKETSFYTNLSSIDRFGRIEEIVYLDKTTTGAAEAYAQTVLQESQNPLSFVIAVKKDSEHKDVSELKVSAVGYAFTLNYQYLSIADSTATIDAVVSDVINTNGQFISEGLVEANAVEVRPPDTETRAFDWLLELAEIGDGAWPYIIQILGERRLSYKKLDATPTLRWDGNQLATRSGRSLKANKWNAMPGILRDLTWDSVDLPSAYFFQNQQDSFVSEIEISVDSPMPLIRSDDQPDSDMMVALTRAQNALARALEREEREREED